MTEVLKEEVAKLDHIKIEWLESWFQIKRSLERMRRNFIDYREYQKRCAKQKIKGQDAQTLVCFLHDLGIVLSFQDDMRLSNTNVLKPEWVTRAVYTLINNGNILANKGVLETAQLSSILDGKSYPRERHGFIIDIMKKFELCFDMSESGRNDSYLIPDLLPKQEPLIEWDESASITFQYHYNFLPNSVISRFIVRMHRYIADEIYWRYGVVLAERKNRAMVRADIKDKKIFIFINGPADVRRDFFGQNTCPF